MIPIMALADGDLTASGTVSTAKLLPDMTTTTSVLPSIPLTFPPRHQVEGTSLVYNDGNVGYSFKDYTTHVYVALALDSNGLLSFFISYQ